MNERRVARLIEVVTSEGYRDAVSLIEPAFFYSLSDKSQPLGCSCCLEDIDLAVLTQVKLEDRCSGCVPGHVEPALGQDKGV
jgi:hypothetical protein